MIIINPCKVLGIILQIDKREILKDRLEDK